MKIGVISGPNLSKEILAGQPAGALVASRYDEVDERVQALFAGNYGDTALVGETGSITHQVENHLPNTSSIAGDLRQVVCNGDLEA